MILHYMGRNLLAFVLSVYRRTDTSSVTRRLPGCAENQQSQGIREIRSTVGRLVSVSTGVRAAKADCRRRHKLSLLWHLLSFILES